MLSKTNTGLGYGWKLGYMNKHFKAITGKTYEPFALSESTTKGVIHMVKKIAPSIDAMYHIPPAAEESKNMTSVHSIIEYMMYGNMEPAEKSSGLGSDLKSMAKMYWSMYGKEENVPKDNAREGGVINWMLSKIMWRFECMHMTQTYIAWMKTPDMDNPGYIFANFNEVNHAPNSPDEEESYAVREDESYKTVRIVNPTYVTAFAEGEDGKQVEVLRFNGHVDAKIAENGLLAHVDQGGDLIVSFGRDGEYQLILGDENLAGDFLAGSKALKAVKTAKAQGPEHDEDDVDDSKTSLVFTDYDLDGEALEGKENHFHNYNTEKGHLYVAKISPDVATTKIRFKEYKK